jgi:hypothetical protein
MLYADGCMLKPCRVNPLKNTSKLENYHSLVPDNGDMQKWSHRYEHNKDYIHIYGTD